MAHDFGVPGAALVLFHRVEQPNRLRRGFDPAGGGTADPGRQFRGGASRRLRRIGRRYIARSRLGKTTGHTLSPVSIEVDNNLVRQRTARAYGSGNKATTGGGGFGILALLAAWPVSDRLGIVAG